MVLVEDKPCHDGHCHGEDDGGRGFGQADAAVEQSQQGQTVESDFDLDFAEQEA